LPPRLLGVSVPISEMLPALTKEPPEEIGQVKAAMNLPVYEPKREEDVFRNVIEHNGGPLTTDALKRIFERIIDEMRVVQKNKMEKEPEC